MSEITIVGGGIAGLVASIACAEGGAPVRLLEAHDQLGGRGRSSDGPFVTNFGPHAIYKNGTLWPWMRERGLLPPVVLPALHKPQYMRVGGKRRRTPPLALVLAIPRLLRGPAPIDVDFRSWVTERAGARAAELLSRSAGVFSYDHDPGRLSAAFVWERWKAVFLDQPTKARFPRGGWSTMIECLETGARAAGVQIETGTPVTELPPAPVIVATELAEARRLLGDGIFLAGDMVAAPGLLAEASATSALEAAQGALTWVEGRIVVSGKDAGSVAYQR